MGEEADTPGQKALAFEELRRQLEKLLKDGSSNQSVFDWIEVRLVDAGGRGRGRGRIEVVLRWMVWE